MNAIKRSILAVFVLCLVTLFVTTVVKTQTGAGHNHVISLATAEKYVNNFKNNPTIPTIKGGLFNRNVIDAILGQPDCVAVRFYYAKEDNGSPTLVVVGVNSSGNDMENGVIAERILPCPPVCGIQGTLNK
jgi:hypothetical protein